MYHSDGRRVIIRIDIKCNGRFYMDRICKKRTGKFAGWTVQIIQHECDHLDGVII